MCTCRVNQCMYSKYIILHLFLFTIFVWIRFRKASLLNVCYYGEFGHWTLNETTQNCADLSCELDDELNVCSL